MSEPRQEGLQACCITWSWGKPYFLISGVPTLSSEFWLIAGVAGTLSSKLSTASNSAGGVTHFLRKKPFDLSKFCSVELEKNVKASVGYIVIFLEKFKVKFSLGKNKTCPLLSSSGDPVHVCLLVPFWLVEANILTITPE